MTYSGSGSQAIIGSAREAAAWIDASYLTRHSKDLLLQFVDRFPDVEFSKDPVAGPLRALEQRDGVVLPSWFHDIRRILHFVSPRMDVRFDDFDSYTPRADYLDEIWYSLETIHMGEEQRSLFVDRAHVYPIGEWEEENRSFLSVRLGDPDDMRILEFAAQDLLDNVLDGKPADVSVRPAFDSYPSLLSHVIAGRLPDGTVIEAR